MQAGRHALSEKIAEEKKLSCISMLAIELADMEGILYVFVPGMQPTCYLSKVDTPL